jgi:hypothetical protein
LKADVCSSAAQVLNNSVEMINLQQVRKYSSYNEVMDFKQSNLRVISDYRREVDENCALLCYYAARQWYFLTDLSGRISCPETSVRNFHFLAA